MKIAVVTSGHVPSQWAHSINTMKHANAFARLGYETEVFTMERCNEANLRRKIDNIYEWYGINELPIHYLKDNIVMYYKEGAYRKRLVKIICYLSSGKIVSWRDPEKKAVEAIKEKHFDLCFCRTYKAVKYSVFAGIPAVLESHCPTPGRVPEILELAKLSRNIYFKGIVTIHEKLRANFIALGFPANKIIVQEDAVDTELFDNNDMSKYSMREILALPLFKKIVLYCGSLKKGKGINIIIETAEQLQNEEDIVFYIVGGTAGEIEKWKEVVEQKKLSNVSFVGYVSGNVVPKYLQSADILFMPYDVKEQGMIMDIETTSPIKIFEYMASGTPIVTTKIPTISKILGEGEGKLVDVDMQSYASVIISLINNYKSAIELGRKAAMAARKFSYQKRCENILTQLCKT